LVRSTFRIVLDTNTLLRGLVGESSAAVKLLRAAESRVVVPLLSKAVLDEYRAVLSDSALTERFSSLNAEFVEVTLRRLRYVGDFVRASNVTFAYRRDPGDEKFIELAIALRASHIVSSDDDLLSLPEEASDAGRRFRQRLPGVEVLEAADFLKRYLDIP
jgi:putative PIN family toxin of toxin-antitoxin system